MEKWEDRKTADHRVGEAAESSAENTQHQCNNIQDIFVESGQSRASIHYSFLDSQDSRANLYSREQTKLFLRWQVSFHHFDQRQ